MFLVGRYIDFKQDSWQCAIKSHYIPAQPTMHGVPTVLLKRPFYLQLAFNKSKHTPLVKGMSRLLEPINKEMTPQSYMLNSFAML